MRKVGLISIQSKLVKKILNGEKIIEIKKRKPKADLPIDIYIYCKPGKLLIKTRKEKQNEINKNDEQNIVRMVFNTSDQGQLEQLNEKVVAKFTLNNLAILDINDMDAIMIAKTGLTMEEYRKYIGNRKNIFVWHIDNLIKFDELLELSEFYKNYNYQKDYNGLEDYCNLNNLNIEEIRIKRPPISWCYAYIEE